jgi:hypothetical protein
VFTQIFFYPNKANKTVFLVQAYQTSQYAVPRGAIFPVQYTRCSLFRLIILLSTWCRAAAFFSASGAALFAGSSYGKINAQPALALNIRFNAREYTYKEISVLKVPPTDK